MLPSVASPRPGIVNVIGMRAVLATATPLSVAGRIMNCGVRAMAADPKPMPAGDSDSTVQALSAP